MISCFSTDPQKSTKRIVIRIELTRGALCLVPSRKYGTKTHCTSNPPLQHIEIQCFDGRLSRRMEMWVQRNTTFVLRELRVGFDNKKELDPVIGFTPRPPTTFKRTHTFWVSMFAIMHCTHLVYTVLFELIWMSEIDICNAKRRRKKRQQITDHKAWVYSTVQYYTALWIPGVATNEMILGASKNNSNLIENDYECIFQIYVCVIFSSTWIWLKENRKLDRTFENGACTLQMKQNWWPSLFDSSLIVLTCRLVGRVHGDENLNAVCLNSKTLFFPWRFNF